MCEFYCFQGAATGMIVGHLVTLWLTYGGLIVEKPALQMLPLSVDGCSNETFSAHIMLPTETWPIIPKLVESEIIENFTEANLDNIVLNSPKT